MCTCQPPHFAELAPRPGYRGLAGQGATVEVPDPLPAIVGRLHPVRGPVHGEERVPRALVAVEFVLLARLGENLVQLIDLLRRRVLVLGAEHAEQGAGQARRKMRDWGE